MSAEAVERALERTWAVVVNWNGGECNARCLRSLLEQGLPPGRIAFVDNASTDGSAEAVERTVRGLRVLRNARNLGYGHGNNRGIELALREGAEFVFLVNNDVTLPAGALAKLLREAARSSDAGIIGPRVLLARRPDRVWCAGGRITFRTNLSAMIGYGKPDGPQYKRTLAVDYVPGCAMLVRREVFERVGLLDGDYFGYHEDVDFCLKACEAGFGVLVIGEAAVHHDAHSSTGGGYNALRKYMMGVNSVWFLRRHGSTRRWLSFVVFDVLSLPFAWMFRALRGEGGAVLAKARGTLDGLRGKRLSEELMKTRFPSTWGQA